MARGLAGAGVLAVLGATAALVVMQLHPPTGLPDPLSTPLSSYALTTEGWLFDTAVLLLVISVLGIAAAVAIGEDAVTGLRALTGMGVCALGLIVVVAMPFHTTPAGRPTTTGWVHIVAAGLVFTGPPLTALALGRRHRPRQGCSRLPRATAWLAATTPAFLTAALIALVTVLETAPTFPAWRVSGILERTLTATDITTALLLAVWTWRGCPCHVPSPPGNEPTDLE